MELFDSSVSVFGAPGRYVQGEHALDMIGSLAGTLGCSVVVLVDEGILELVQARLQKSFDRENITCSFLTFSGELLRGTGERLAGELSAMARPDTVVGVGGGRAIDASKALAEHLEASLVTVPTIASNDAPTSKNFVFYNGDHELVEVRHRMRNPDFVLVDEGLIASAPKEFLATGLGDAIAKRFEAEACLRAGGKNMFAAAPTRTAAAIADTCYQTLIEHGCAAMSDAGKDEVTPALSATIEATILMAGLAFENGGLSLAHAMTRGLSKIPDAKEAPHGFQVAYALLIQLELEGRKPDAGMLELYRAASLPMSLAELAGRTVLDCEIGLIAAETESVVHMKNFIEGTSASDIASAMRAIENGETKTGGAEE